MKNPIYLTAETSLYRWKNGVCQLMSGDTVMDIPEAVANAIQQGFYDDTDRFLTVYLSTLKNCALLSEGDTGASLSIIEYDNLRFPILNWAITNRCNLSCRHCFMAKDLNPNSFEPSLEQCLSFLDDVVSCGIRKIRLSGGEPLIHRHFDEIIQGIADRGLYLESIATNGAYLKDRFDVIAECGFSPRIDMSFDGVGIHDWMRAKDGAEEEAIETIEFAQSKGLPIMVQYSLYEGNKDVLLATAKLLADMGVDCLRVNRLGESERWLAGGYGPCLSSSEYYDFAEDFVRTYLSQGIEMDLHFWSYAYISRERKLCNSKAAVSPDGVLQPHCNACDSVRRMIAVSPDGEVAPCAQVFGFLAADKTSWGNAYQDGLVKILSDSRAVNYTVATIEDVKSHSQDCSSCEWFFHCGGGCRAVAFGLTRDYYAKDPTRCAYFLEGHHEKLLSMMDDFGYSVC